MTFAMTVLIIFLVACHIGNKESESKNNPFDITGALNITFGTFAVAITSIITLAVVGVLLYPNM